MGVFIGGGVIAYVFDRSLKQERELEWRATHEFFDTGIRRICFSFGNGIVRTSGLSDPRFNVFWTISPYVEHVKEPPQAREIRDGLNALAEITPQIPVDRLKPLLTATVLQSSKLYDRYFQTVLGLLHDADLLPALSELEYKSEYIRDNVLGRELDSPNTVYPFQLAEMLERLEACCDVLDRVRRTG